MCVVRVLTLTRQYPLKAANPIIPFLLPSNLSAFLPYFIIFILGFLFFLRLFLFFTFHSCLLFFCHTLFICPFLLSHIYTLCLTPSLSLFLSLTLCFSLLLRWACVGDRNRTCLPLKCRTGGTQANSSILKLLILLIFPLFLWLFIFIFSSV